MLVTYHKGEIMKKLILLLVIICPIILGQEVNKPIIIEKSKLNELTIASQSVQIAFLNILNVAPTEVVQEWKKAQKEQEEVYKKVFGFPSTELKNYDISDGVDGAIILKKKTTTITTGN
jgi:hypothetical protein